jgi:hypothetical protein
MQTYGHLRRDHSQAAAQRVQFDGLVPPRSKQPAVAPPAK